MLRVKIRSSSSFNTNAIRKWYANPYYLLNIVSPFVVIAFLLPSYLIGFSSSGVGLYHDDSIYMVTAKSIANNQGYRIISLPSEQVQTKYPPLYPLILSAIWKIFPDFPDNIFWFKTISFASIFLWCLAIQKFVNKVTGNLAVANWSVAIIVCSPWVFFLTGFVLPDILFGLLSILAIYLVYKVENKLEPILREVVFAGLVCSTTFLVSTKGIVLIVTSFISLFFKLKKRMAAIFLITCALFCGPWIVWQSSQKMPDDRVEKYYSKLCYEEGHIGALGLDQAVQAMKMNILYIVCGYSQLLGFSWIFPPVIWLTFGIVFMVLLMLGWSNDIIMRRNFGVINLWVLGYHLMLIFWVWPPARYMVVLLPISLIFVWKGLNYPVFKPIPMHIKNIVCAFLIISITISAGATIFSATKNTLNDDIVSLGTTHGLAFNKWEEAQVMFNWISNNIPKKAVVAANLDPLIFLFNDIKSIRSFGYNAYQLYYEYGENRKPLGTVEDLRSHILKNEISYIIVDPMKAFGEEQFLKDQIEELNSKYPRALRYLATPGNSNFIAAEVDRDSLYQ